jgi:predicted transcriptional regulator
LEIVSDNELEFILERLGTLLLDSKEQGSFTSDYLTIEKQLADLSDAMKNKYEKVIKLLSEVTASLRLFWNFETPNS